MQPYKRQTFICSAIEQCRETVNCCPHKQPHIKDERCVPRECRYAPGVGNIDCDPFDLEHPRVPIPPVIETRTVEQVMKEKEVLKNGDILDATISGTIESDGKIKLESVAISKETAKELDIKEAVKEAAQHPVTIVKPAHKKGGKKKTGSS